MAALRILVHRRRVVLTACLGLTALAAPGLLRIEIDNSPEVFFVHDAAERAQYRRLQRTFGSFQALRIVVSGPGTWTRDGLEWLGLLERQVPGLPGVLGTAGLWGRYRGDLPAWPPDDPASFRELAIQDTLNLNAGWVSHDGETVTLLVAMRHLSASDRGQALEELGTWLDRAPAGIDARMAGLPVLNQALDDAMIMMAARFFPVLVLLAATLLGVFLRRGRDIALPLLLVTACEILVLGAMGWVGASINIVTVVLVPLLFVITLSTSAHVLLENRRIRETGVPPEAAVIETYRSKGWAVLWTGVTTCVGFGSLALSQVPPVRSLGMWSALGIALMTVLAFTLYPGLLANDIARSTATLSPFENWAHRKGSALADGAIRHRRLVFLGFATVALVCLAGLTRLRVETHALTYLRVDHPVRAELEELEAHGIGVTGADLLVVRHASQAPSDPPPEISLENLRRLERLTRELRAEPLVLGALSAADFARQEPIDKSPEGRPENLLMQRAQKLLYSGDTARVAMLTPMIGFSELEPLFDHAVASAQKIFPMAEVWVTGRYPLVLAAQRTLLRTMLTSLSITVLCIAAILYLLVRRIRLAGLALIPNLWPVAIVLGAMGWLGVPIDSATVMIAAVVLGLAVDDTVHTLGHFRRLTGKLGPPEAARETLRGIAPAHVLTSVILATGFAACGLSNLVPVSRFGALSAAAILMALAADLILVPALLAGVSRQDTARL